MFGLVNRFLLTISRPSRPCYRGPMILHATSTKPVARLQQYCKTAGLPLQIASTSVCSSRWTRHPQCAMTRTR